ncbi:MoaD/ThiS family protein [Candidatus Woesearchaeota archaeon]|nr:MoaD/ThiS family protein [Candidatus Woesearchaeota archaeon]MCF7900643.1 MoaD/ThiS family protein [Candidatus Woesearchaeota archaeon]MCF8013483.1 MoaD/ThiS family protein [Candidatus Woesearchaeota archaeon]
MKIIIERTKEEKELDFKGTIEELLQKLKINKEEVIVARNGALVTLDTELSSEDEIKILSVISGG